MKDTGHRVRRRGPDEADPRVHARGGLRNLEREIASIIRKVARKRAEGLTEKVAVTPEKVEEFLGAPSSCARSWRSGP
jgi:ATP-dependent Lon protease